MLLATIPWQWQLPPSTYTMLSDSCWPTSSLCHVASCGCVVAMQDVVVPLHRMSSCEFAFLALQDLTYQKQVSLSEALTGCEFTIRHLDNRTIRVRPRSSAAYDSGCLNSRSCPSHVSSRL